MTLMAGASDWRVLVSPNTNGATQMGALGIENKVGVALGANQILSKVRLLGISRFRVFERFNGTRQGPYLSS